MGAAADLPARLVALAEPVAIDQGVDLIDVEIKGPPNRRVVRLVADAVEPGEGLDIDRITSLSRAVGDVLDDAINGAYTLEVTSPGLDRPLTRPRDFVRNVGHVVAVHLVGFAEDDAPITGTITSVDADLVLDVDGTPTVLAFSDIDHGTVVLPW